MVTPFFILNSNEFGSINVGHRGIVTRITALRFRKWDQPEFYQTMQGTQRLGQRASWGLMVSRFTCPQGKFILCSFLVTLDKDGQKIIYLETNVLVRFLRGKCRVKAERQKGGIKLEPVGQDIESNTCVIRKKPLAVFPEGRWVLCLLFSLLQSTCSFASNAVMSSFNNSPTFFR